MLKTYSFLLFVEALPLAGYKVTCSQTHSQVENAIDPIFATTEKEAIDIAVQQLEMLVKFYIGWERRRISLKPFIRKTYTGAYHVVFEVDI